MENVNEFELLIVSEHLRKQGIANYSLRKGNNCIWASYGVINSYYFFSDGELIDIQFD